MYLQRLFQLIKWEVTYISWYDPQPKNQSRYKMRV